MSITFNDMYTMFKAIMTNWDYIDVCRYKKNIIIIGVKYNCIIV